MQESKYTIELVEEILEEIAMPLYTKLVSTLV
jgi:hypothetical protein